MSEYERQGHMNIVPKKTENNVSYYMPHHNLLREESSTTKLRVVFDVSAALSTGISLNNLQMVGPTVQDDLLAMLLRFRQAGT